MRTGGEGDGGGVGSICAEMTADSSREKGMVLTQQRYDWLREIEAKSGWSSERAKAHNQLIVKPERDRERT